MAPGSFYCAPVADDPNAIRIESGGAGSGFESGWMYRVRPTNALRCATTGLPAVSMDDAWLIEIDGAGCDGDLDGDGQVAVADLLVLIACWVKSMTRRRPPTSRERSGRCGRSALR